MHQRLLILAEGELGVFTAKTATCLVRYRPEHVVGVLDSVHAGRTTREVLGTPAAVPVVGTIAEGMALRPDALVIGIAPPGGALPEAWRPILRACLDAGVAVLSGLHTFLGDDPELARLARERGTEIVDLRRPPADQPIAGGRARSTRARRILTVGTDCNVGKMAATVELVRAARRRGLRAEMAATGQTGMLIAGSGVTLDRVPGDFMAGWAERLVLERGDADLVVVEGQGCLLHPAYSGVTLALLHGSLPDAMVLVHHAGRETIRYQETAIPPLPEWVRRYEDALAPLHRGRVAALAINPSGLTREQAEAAIARAEDETGLPAADVVREGAERLLAAALADGK
ncbi:MAG: DUF1611 domain-containing protein [Armatimonadota bacterium]